MKPPAKLIFLAPLTTQRHAQKPSIKQHTEVFFVSFISTATASEVRGELKVGREKRSLNGLKKIILALQFLLPNFITD